MIPIYRGIYSYFVFLLLCLVLFPLKVLSSSIIIETDYRLRGISYSNLDYNKNTSTDVVSYYSQKLNLSLIGKFNEGIEIGSKISALGIAGNSLVNYSSTTISFPSIYQNTSFMPYVETAYLKIKNFSKLPIDIFVGKQNFNYGEGLIISDNNIGFTGFRLIAHYPYKLPSKIKSFDTEIFTAKVSDGLKPDKDHDIYGGIGSFVYKEALWEIGYFEDRDFSGSEYRQGQLSTKTKGIVKRYYDIRWGNNNTNLDYQFEIAQQKGYILKEDNSKINLSGFAYVVRGELKGKKENLGKISARALFAIFSGDDNTQSINDDDESFTPPLTKRYDGLEQTGYGNLFAATPLGAFLDTPDLYSGINTLSVGGTFSPWYAWKFDVAYYLYSASQGPKGAPTASGFERLFGAEYALGVELDFSIIFTYSKYLDTRFIYARYTPPKFETFWIKNESNSKYLFEINCKF